MQPPSSKEPVRACATCGGSSAPDAQRCRYCGSALPRTAPRASVAPPPSGAPASPYGAWGRVTWWYFAGVMALVVVSTTVAGFQSRRAARHAGVATSAGDRAGPSTTLPGAAPIDVDDLVAILSGGHDVLIGIRQDGRQLARFDARASALRWRIQLLSKYGVDRDRVALGPGAAAGRDGAVFVADDSRLLALRLDDGARIWEVPLMAGVGASCRGCVRMTGDQVVVLEQDGSLRAFDTRTGQQAWERALKHRPRQLDLADDKILVGHPTETRRRAWRYDLLDPATGDVTTSVDPRCRSLKTFPDEGAGAFSTRMISPDGASMFVQFGDFRLCYQRWDLRTGKLVWGDNFADRGLGPIALLGGGTLLIATDKAVHALDEETGARHSVVQDDQHNLQPVIARAGLVVVTAAPNWDSSKKRFFLWAHDPATGRRLWQYASNQKPDSWNGSNPWWAIHDSDAGVVVLQFQDAKHLSVDTLDHRTGASAGRKTIAVDSEKLAPTWDGGLVWLDGASTLRAIDVATGRIAYHVP